jgi:hypothetical protein
MKSLLGKLEVILVGLIIFGYVEVRGADWEKYDESETMAFYYAVESITHPSKDVVRVWEKRVYKVKGITEMVEEFGNKYETLSHMLILSELDCVEKKMKGLSFVNYSTGGKILSSSSSGFDWAFIDPDSIGETLYKILCK